MEEKVLTFQEKEVLEIQFWTVIIHREGNDVLILKHTK